jgi:hypothetical protein
MQNVNAKPEPLIKPAEDEKPEVKPDGTSKAAESGATKGKVTDA